MNLISAFYYYLECSVIYVQQRVWGRFYNESIGLISKYMHHLV